MSNPQLSSGILSKLLNGAENDTSLWDGGGHVVQLLSLKKINASREGNGPVDRYRFVVSDGVHYTQAMLATQLSHMVDDGHLQKNTVVKLDKVTCNKVSAKKILIILGLTFVQHVDNKIGEPESIDMPAQESGITATSSGATARSPSTNVTNSARPAVKKEASSTPMPSKGPVVYPIEGLSPYQSKWTIKVRVVQKSDVRHWSNQKGEGKIFNVTLMDDSGAINATGFNQTVDELYDKLEEGKTYYVSKARVGISKKKFSTVSNEYELTLTKETEIQECTDPSEAPKIKYNFVPLGELEGVPKDAMCDVIGVVKDVADVTEILTKTNKQLKKRELTLVDLSEFAVRLTLWGKQAENFKADEHAVIAFKGLKVGDFNGRTLSMVNSSLMTIDPDITEAHSLRGWFDAKSGAGQTPAFKSFSGTMGGGLGSSVFKREEIQTLTDVKDSGLGSGDAPASFSCRATVVHIKADNLTYTACPTCNKKVIEGSEGWRCEKCDQSYEKPTHRYILQMSAADHSGQAWLSGFNEAAEVVFGQSADELMNIREQDERLFTKAVQKATCNTFNFVCRAKQETYNDQTRMRYTINKILPLDYKEEAKYLRDVLKSDWAK